MHKHISCLLLLGMTSSLPAVDRSPWEESYVAFVQARSHDDAATAYQEAGRFIEYGRLQFIQSDDIRLPDVSRYWEKEHTKRLETVPPLPAVPVESALPMPQPSVVPISRERKVRRPRKKPATTDLVKRADQAIRNGRYDEAERLLERAKALDPESDEIRRKWQALEAEMNR